MTAKRKRSGKGLVEGTAATAKSKRSGKGVVVGTAAPVNERLPSRLFATDRYPSNRNNCYSSLEFLLLVRDVLEGSVEMERLLCSSFGSLFRLPVRRCAFSGKLVHGMLCRQLVTKKRFEMWPVFGGGPTRFSLAEFGHVTGLPCGEFEPGYEVDDKAKPKKADYVFWDKLFGGRRNLTVDDLAAMVAGESTMSQEKKFRICLIIIVDGVLMPKIQKPKPTLQYVKLVENLDKFFSFQWGRESFWWTISTMLPAKKVLGKCDDPEGAFCAQLRQDSKFLLGFPLALQLWAFEAIPVLLDRLGGDDSVTLLSYIGDKLPTHTGLVLTDVLSAENNPKLTVLPMVDVHEDRDDGWGVFDCEILDRKVSYMVGLLKSGHKFEKGKWGGGDAGEPLYVHDPTANEVKRKIRKLTHNAEAGPVMKQRRLSRYFSRKGPEVGDKYEVLLDAVGELKKELGRLNKVVEKQGRMLKKYKAKSIGKFSSSRGLLSRRKRVRPVVSEDIFGGSDQERTHKSSDEMEDELGGGSRSTALKEGDEIPLLYSEKVDGREQTHVVQFGSGSNTFYVTEEEGSDEAGDLGIPGAVVDCGTEVDFGELNRLVGVITREEAGAGAENEGRKPTGFGEKASGLDGIEPQVHMDKGREVVGDASQRGKLIQGPEEKTTDSAVVKVGDEKVALVTEGMEAAGDASHVGKLIEGPQDQTSVEATGGVKGERITDSSTGAERARGTDVEEVEDVANKEPLGGGVGSDKDESGAVEDVTEAKDDNKKKGSLISEGDGLNCANAEEDDTLAVQPVRDGQSSGVEGEAVDVDGSVDEQVMDLSDSSPCQRSEKHKPVEREAELASLLLAKEPFTMDKIVPTAEDTDYRFFENVLIGNPKVLHLNAGKFDLDNQFFIELATSQEWVSTKHIEALVEYIAARHEDTLKERRCLFLPSWFVAHLQGKTRAFNAAKVNRGRVLGDGRLSGFLTKEGRKWGVDVDTLYAPMIWDDNHWVGLCISLTDWRVLVLDPNPRLKNMEEVRGVLESVSKMIPFLVEKVCPVPESGPYGLEPFTVERMGGAYENRRSGDCGPVSVKLMELHALGNPHPRMDGLTDDLVDIMRRQWAMDIYKDWVVPVYVGEEMV
ncbi:uncharacterized protein LOC117133909 isoform X2 [Brassica rapa]|uniref:uncharacterized protein LOC117133909 isoform X2 n=1 Tax=Brassica campestris TaxID=3711 RepID=UPI00142D4B07|nr:uncharacterized protein LOC117133909 isoform X2 [Brassica rapa]